MAKVNKRISMAHGRDAVRAENCKREEHRSA